MSFIVNISLLNWFIDLILCPVYGYIDMKKQKPPKIFTQKSEDDLASEKEDVDDM